MANSRWLISCVTFLVYIVLALVWVPMYGVTGVRAVFGASTSVLASAAALGVVAAYFVLRHAEHFINSRVISGICAAIFPVLLVAVRIMVEMSLGDLQLFAFLFLAIGFVQAIVLASLNQTLFTAELSRKTRFRLRGLGTLGYVGGTCFYPNLLSHAVGMEIAAYIAVIVAIALPLALRKDNRPSVMLKQATADNPRNLPLFLLIAAALASFCESVFAVVNYDVVTNWSAHYGTFLLATGLLIEIKIFYFGSNLTNRDYIIIGYAGWACVFSGLLINQVPMIIAFGLNASLGFSLASVFSKDCRTSSQAMLLACGAIGGQAANLSLWLADVVDVREIVFGIALLGALASAILMLVNPKSLSVFE